MRTVVDAISGRRGGRGTLAIGSSERATVPWGEVHRRARLVARDLTARGVQPGDRVALLGESHVDLVVALQATWLAGAAVTVLPLPVPSVEGPAYVDHLRRIVTDARPRLALAGDPDGLGAAAITPVVPVADLHAVAAAATDPGAPASAPAPVSPADLAVLQYTSGSTRSPRGVPVTHGQLAANLDAILIATDHDRVHGSTLSWLPLYHDMGLVGILCTSMTCGCDLTLLPTAGFAAQPRSWLEQIAATGATVTAAPNFAWALAARLLRAIPAPDPAVDLRSLRCAASGGEPIDPVAMAGFLASATPHGFDPGAFVCAYGLAEATLAVTVSRPGAGLRTDTVDREALERRGAAVPAGTGRALTRLGRPVPGTRVRIVAAGTGGEARVLADRRVGRIEVAGPGVTGGYWGAPAAASDGWLPTGDLGYLTGGELVVCGRAADLLFAAGRNIHPQDVEALAVEVPRVRAGGAAAFGVPGGGIADRLAVVVESPSWADADEAESVCAAVRGAIVAGLGLAPRQVAVVPPGELARTSSGKLRRHEIRARLLAGTLPTAAVGAASTPPGKARR
ncbi:AMP-binding protein [Actinoplanes sp. NPDC049118]|uniref:AMP-binding protein n=1 Tax=Actinoplanes sp. NPDC049118 TaxID=3155769 RepID=UPI0034084CF4